MHKLQLTLAIIKPHAVKNPIVLSYVRNILKKKFIVIRTKRILLDVETAKKFYEEHMGKFFFNRLITFMASGAIDLHILGHTNAIEYWRQILGPTKVYKAQLHNPSCLRSRFGLSDTRNVAHGSDSETSAQREIQFFFPDFSYCSWYNNDEVKYRNGQLIFNNYLFQHVCKV